MEINHIATMIGLGVAIQFVAAILGPGVLRFASILLVLAAGGLAGYLAYLGLNEQYAGIGSDTIDLATQFGVIAGTFLVSHFFMRWLFRCMARCSHVTA